MQKNIYLTEKGLEIDLNDFSEVNAHLQSDNLLKVDWGEISEYQKLSEAFIEKFEDKLFFEYKNTIIVIKSKNIVTYISS